MLLITITNELFQPKPLEIEDIMKNVHIFFQLNGHINPKYYYFRHCKDEDFDGFRSRFWSKMKKNGTEKSYLCIDDADKMEFSKNFNYNNFVIA